MKAVLVIDIPDDSSCIDCPCMAWDDEADWIGCHLTARMTGIWSERKAKRPKWCPLRPMPTKIDDYRFLKAYQDGWNACLEEILDETV